MLEFCDPNIIKMHKEDEQISNKTVDATKKKSDLSLKPKPLLEEESSFLDLRTKRGQILFFLITISIPLLFQFIPNEFSTKILLKNNQCEYSCPRVSETSLTDDKIIKRPTYWVYGKNLDGGHLKHVHLVLKRLGYQLGANDSDWDLLWAHDYPFGKLQNQMSNLKQHQKVNHFPGCGYITNKVDLATTNIKYIPKSFKLPVEEIELREFSEKFPKKQFVQKHNQHRFIQIKSLDEIDFSNNDTFVQEFIDNPLLVDGHKFDIGIYTIITSIDPLRVYIYSGDVLFRYCPVKYYPFDANNVDKYIVGDDYLPTWEVPSLSQYYNGLGLGMKGSFDAYLKSKERDPADIWLQVEDAIRIAIVEKEKHIANILNQKYPNKKNFFELMRFDLVIDDDFNVYLMEANMSPNLSSAHFPPNQLLYEQVIYHSLGLVGVGSNIYRESLKRQPMPTENMQSSDKNIAVNALICSQLPCSESCAPAECHLCKPCLSTSDLNEIHTAYREHIRRGETKRIFPKPILNKEFHLKNEEEFIKLTPKNQFMSKWFYQKCIMDSNWCT